MSNRPRTILGSCGERNRKGLKELAGQPVEEIAVIVVVLPVASSQSAGRLLNYLRSASRMQL